MNISKKSPILNILWHQFILPIRIIVNSVDILYIPNVTLLTVKVCKTIVIIHDMIEFNIKKKFSRIRMFYRKYAVPITAKRADHIITVSENSKEDIIKYCNVLSSKITVIYNGVDNSYYKRKNSEVIDVLQKYSIKSPYILYVGTIDHPGKNSISLIKAFSIVLKYHPNYKLVLIGAPGFGYKYILDEIDKLGIVDDVILPGYVKDAELPLIYNGAKLFVLLSLYEGFGLPLVEAMACGTPIIASNRSCFPEILEGLEVLVEPHDIDDIAKKILTLIKDNIFYNQISLTGLEKSKKYKWENTARETLNVFNQILTK